jgi:hypothetical protein
LVEENLDIQLILASSYLQCSMVLNNIFKDRGEEFQVKFLLVLVVYKYLIGLMELSIEK